VGVVYFVKEFFWSEAGVGGCGRLDGQFSGADFSLVRAFHQSLFTPSKWSALQLSGVV